MLLDRIAERSAIDHLIELARDGSSGVLVLRGEPGIGKTTLLEHAIESAPDFSVAHVVAAELEMRMPFAAVHQLIAPMLGGLDDLPEPQRVALGSALGLVKGTSPNRLLVGLATLTLLSNQAEQEPLLCVVDDAHWLDQASAEALAFVARRLLAEGIAFLFAAREPFDGAAPLEGLPDLHVTGLPQDAAAELLARAVGGPLGADVRDRIIAHAGGNPLALLELSRGLTPEQLAGTSVLPAPLPLTGRLEQNLLQRVRRLPLDTQALLLLLAVEPDDGVGLFWRAADELGIAAEALHPAESEGVVKVGPPVTFSHPLVRSAVYGSASPDERRRIHQALAAAIDPTADPDRRAWHRAAIALGPNEVLAAELERSADRAADRGGYAAAAALLERSAELTPDRRRRAERWLAAAEAELAAGAVGRSSTLLNEAASKLADEPQLARAERLRGEIQYQLGTGGDTHGMLLQAARTLEPRDLRLARDTHLDALMAAAYAGGLAGRDGLRDASLAALAAPPIATQDAREADYLLDGFATNFALEPATAAPKLRVAIERLRDSEELRLLGIGCHAAVLLWDDEAVQVLATRWLDLAREAGALSVIPHALTTLGSVCEVHAGRFDAADVYIQEARELSAAMEIPVAVDRADAGALVVSAWRGLETETRATAETSKRNAAARGDGIELAMAHHAIAVLELGYGRYRAALSAARRASENGSMSLVASPLPDLVEAAARSGEAEVAASALERLSESALAGGTDWGLGVLARSRALLAEDADAEELYREAIERLEVCRAISQLARANLVYGEWLRRRRRRVDAREQLLSAHEALSSMGANGFAERARIELRATGEHVGPRRAATAESLTPHETRIAGLVSEGSSNPEIAAQLFISPRTVEYHLAKIFRKLEVTSRTELARRMLEART